MNDKQKTIQLLETISGRLGWACWWLFVITLHTCALSEQTKQDIKSEVKTKLENVITNND